MTDEEKKALIQVKYFNKLTRYWQQEEYEDYEIKKYIETVLNLIEKQSKMIDLMAEQLTSPINGKEWVIKYYEKEAKKNNG